ncbi:PIN domain-containing protein [Coraliomargarita algicola]|uniref:PIN domain-containing protein n=1 Tax=Coraliomargarita algicola TaxID=3092156 RepID=A0ABZ0RJL1_9BACT|nr:PIN domain-containing protein [Coraliomargarita sp. J2-16]WPJ95658.1 PIN domain-containing protein [Coraliomargarita sp. J2-16]
MQNAFVDTNILVYAADESLPINRKTQIARKLLLQRGLHLSVQVLNEFIVNARNRKKLNLTAQEELDWIERWLMFPIQDMTAETFLDARLFHERYQVSHWDGLILAAAQKAKCQRLYSEDLQSGQFYDDIEVINPFI